MTAILPFLFDPEKGETAEGVARKRKIAEYLAARQGAPKNLGEGINAVGEAIEAITLARRSKSGEEAGRLADFGPDDDGLGADFKSTFFPPEPAATPAAPPITIGSAGSSGYPSAPPSAAPVAAPAYPPPMAFNGGASPPMGGAPTPTELTAFLAQGAAPTNLNLAPVFMPRLAKFLADAPGGGIKIRSGFRDVATQARLFADAVRKYGSEAAARKWVAPPGASQHNKGAAVDLAYASPAQKKWAHDNAAAYGLTFPMSWEDWHIQPDPNFKGSLPSGGSIPTAGMGGGYPSSDKVIASLRPTQVASLDPSIGLPDATPPPPLGFSPGVSTVAAALPPKPPAGSLAPSATAPSMLQPPGAPPAGGPPPMAPMAAGSATSSAMGVMPPAAPRPQAGAGLPVAAPAASPMSSQAMKYLTSQWATQNEREIAKLILEKQIKDADPATKLALKKAQLDIENAEIDLYNARNPAPTGHAPGTVLTDSKGNIVRTIPAAPEKPTAPTTREIFDKSTGLKTVVQYNPLTGEWDPIGGTEAPPKPPATTPSPLTKLIDERNAALKANPNDPNLALYDKAIAHEAAGEKGWSVEYSPDGTMRLTQGDVPGQSPDEIAAAAEAKKRGETIPVTFSKIADDLPAADQMLQSVGQLGTLLQGLETGAEPALLQWLQSNFGISLGKQADKRQAVESVISYLTPRMRVPGAGASSDRDMNTFRAALPSLMGSPGGNRIVVDTLAALAERRVQMALIAHDYGVGTITAPQALEQMRALPDAFATFRASQPKGAGSAPASGYFGPGPNYGPGGTPAADQPPEAWLKGGGTAAGWAEATPAERKAFGR